MTTRPGGTWESMSQMRLLASSCDRPRCVSARVSSCAAPILACPAPKKRNLCSCSFGTPACRWAPSNAPSMTAAVACMSSLKVAKPCRGVHTTDDATHL